MIINGKEVRINRKYESLKIKVQILLDVDVNEMPMSKQVAALSLKDTQLAKSYEESFEKKICLEHLLTRENPVLELKEHESFFDYSTDYVRNGDSYLQENPIGNKDIVLKRYKPTPFISMPIAQ